MMVLFLSSTLYPLLDVRAAKPGPDFWGLLNPKWSHCNKGRRQSPIDIDPDLLLFDPGLQAINIEGNHVSHRPVLRNTNLPAGGVVWRSGE